jgi:hypothetical protein
MINLDIFDPAMCCSTGLCGPSIDPELLRLSTVINVLHSKGIIVRRHNLSQEPQEYANNKVVSNLLRSQGVNALPITVLNGEIVKSGSYPTNKEFAEWLGINEFELSARKIKRPNNCCSGKTGCC